MLPEKKPENKPPVKPKVDGMRKKPIVRTYESDVSSAIKKKKTSMVDIVMAQRKGKEAKSKVPKPKTEKKPISKDKLLRIGLIVGIIIAVLFLGYGIYSIFSTENPDNGVKITDLNEIIFVNDRIGLETTGLDKRRIMSKILDIKDGLDPTLGTIVNVYPVKEVVVGEGEKLSSQKMKVDAAEFLQNIGATLPSILERSLTGEFMFGFHMTGTVEPFLILKVNSFENAFAGMINWEENIDGDLEFLIEERLKRSATIHATSSAEVVGLLKDFEDTVIKNRDVRIMRDKNNEDILMYTLPDRKTVVITTNENTLIEVLDRLARAKFSR